MKKLSDNQKLILAGGAKKGTKKVSTPKANNGGGGKEASSNTILNNHFHNLGLVAISAVASVGHAATSVQELLNKTRGYEPEKKYKTYKTALRPNFRFGQSYYNSSITFGMPWYY